MALGSLGTESKRFWVGGLGKKWAGIWWVGVRWGAGRVAGVMIKNHDFLMVFKELLWISFCILQAVQLLIFAANSFLTTLFRCTLFHTFTISCRLFSMCSIVKYVFFSATVFTVGCNTSWMDSVLFGNSEWCKNCWHSGAS